MLFVVRCSLCVVCGSLVRVVRCSLFVVCCLLLVICRFVVCYSLFGVRSSLCVG